MISNELLFILFLIMQLLLPVAFLKGGKAWLFGYIAINNCLLIPMAPLTTDVFNHVISITTIAWAPMYLITDILTEKYGKTAAISGLLLSCVTGFIVVLIIQCALLFTPSPESQEWHTHLSIIYQYSTRMVLIGTAVFFISQMLDIHIYDYIHKKTGEKYLWLRNNASTLFTTFFNNILFWWLVFGNVLEDWWSTAIASYLLTVIVALSDTPFVYLAKWIKPLDKK